MSSLQIALTIASLASVVLPLVLKVFPQKDLSMATIAYVASFIVTAVALFLSGQIHISDFASLPSAIAVVVAVSGVFYTIQQAVFHVLSAVKPELVH